MAYIILHLSPADNVAPPPTTTITTTTPRPRPRGLPLCDQAPRYMQLLPPPPPPRPRPQTTSCRRSSDFTTHLQRETPQNLGTDHKLSEIQQPQHTPAKRESCKNLPPNSAAHTCKKNNKLSEIQRPQHTPAKRKSSKNCPFSHKPSEIQRPQHTSAKRESFKNHPFGPADNVAPPPTIITTTTTPRPRPHPLTTTTSDRPAGLRKGWPVCDQAPRTM